MARLLVSVRSVSEAEAALDGGASLIDVKEASNGPLGRAGASTIAGVIRTVSRRTPISAALGELTQCQEIPQRQNLDFVKWGLANSGPRWRENLSETAGRWTAINGHCQPVAVAYADWRQARSPPPRAVWGFARDNGWRVFLLDTFKKDGRTLLDWISSHEIDQIGRRCRDHGVLLALAGSLGRKEIIRLLPLKPDIFAVRGAVCRGQDRTGIVDAALVRQIAELLPIPNYHADLIACG